MSFYNFPNQRISEKEKNKDAEFDKRHIYSYLTYSSTSDYAGKRKEMRDLYFAYSAQLTDEEELKVRTMITERCGENFGPQYFVYPLAESKVEELVGKYRKRPLKRKFMVNNEEAVIKKLDAKIDLVSEKILRDVNKDLENTIGFSPDTPQPEKEIPEDIEEFFSKDYRTISEEVAEDISYQLLIVRKEKEKIYEALKHHLIVGRVFAFMDEKDGHPSIFIPHMLDCFYDVNPNKMIQDDPQYFVFDKYMTSNEIFNTFELNETEKEKVEEYANGSHSHQNGTNSYNWFKEEGSSIRPRVVSMIWKSKKKIKFKSFKNKRGNEEYKILSEDYKERNRDKGSIKTVEIDDIRHITMLGPDIVLEHGSLDKQMKTKGAPKKRFLPVVGLIDDNSVGTGEIRSLVKKLVYLQDFASEIMYEIRLAMRKVDGNVLVWDLANMPKEWMQLGGPEAALKKANFYLKRDNMQIINSRDKRANPYASSVNVSQRGRLDEMMNLLALIERLADKISGINSQESQYAKATTAEINYQQSSDRIEEYFGIFDTWVEKLMERIILKAKHVYEENQVFSFFGGDSQQQFLKIMPEFFMEDIGAHIADNRIEYERKKRIDEVASNTFANAQSPEMMRDLIKIWNSDGSTEAEAILDRGIKAMNAQREEDRKAQQEADQAAEQKRLAERQEDADLKREGYASQEKIAEIYADNKANDTNVKTNAENLRKMAEIEKELQITREKLAVEIAKNNQSDK